MNLLIKGLKIPKNTESFRITIDVFPDVTYYKTMFGANCLYSGTCKIFIMPEKYGRLIDADQLSISVLKAMDNGDDSVIGLIDKTPTIIEAEQGDG